jgi:membrane glycosyltransferase
MTMPISIPSPAPIEKAISVLKNVSSNEFKATFWILLKEDMMVLGDGRKSGSAKPPDTKTSHKTITAIIVPTCINRTRVCMP